MTNADYRQMAGEIRELIPLLLHPQAVADLRLLADRYDRLADYLEVAPGKLPDRPLECGDRQADMPISRFARTVVRIRGARSDSTQHER